MASLGEHFPADLRHTHVVEISPDVRIHVVAAVKFAKTLDKDKKSRIIAALSQL